MPKLTVAEGAESRYSAEAHMRRQAAAIYAQGYLSETTTRGSGATSTAETSSQINGCPLGLAKGDTVTGLVVESTAVGVGITLAKVALIRVDGVVLGVSASVHADWIAAAGGKAVPFLNPVLITDDDAYFACHLQVTGTSCAALARGAGVAAAGGSIIAPGRIGMGFKLAAQADFPAVGASLSVATIGNVKWWMAAY